MKAINITPQVIKMEETLQKKGSKVAGYVLEQAFNKEQIQVFKDTDSNLFWFEDHGAAKYAVNHIRTQIIKIMKLEYRDAWKDQPVKKEVVVKNEYDEAQVKAEAIADLAGGKENLTVKDVEDLKEFVNKYMSGYQMSVKFKKKDDLNEEEMAAFVKELHNAYQPAIQTIVNKIYGGKKPNYRNKSRMDAEERSEFNLNNHTEFEWFLNTLIWMAKPSRFWIREHRKFSTKNYLAVSGELANIVQNALIINRQNPAF